jgi:hypothetical protein
MQDLTFPLSTDMNTSIDKSPCVVNTSINKSLCVMNTSLSDGHVHDKYTQEKSSGEIFKSLLKNKKELVDYLHEHGDYKNIKKILHDIELTHSANNTIEKLLLEANITELPTKELIKFISSICTIFEIKNVMEIFSESDILSELLKKYIEYSYNEIDKVIQYNNLFDNHNLNEIISSRTCIIANWPSNIDTNNLLQFVSNTGRRIPVIIVIGDILNRTIHKTFVTKMEQFGYYNAQYNVKQICWADYFLKNTSNNTTSKMMVFVSKSENINAQTLQSFFDSDIFCTIPGHTEKKENIKTLLQDLVIQNKIPEWILESEQLSYILDVYKKICKYKNFNCTIPSWIRNIQELTFWYLLIKHKLLPHIFFKDSSKVSLMFYEYYDLITNLANKGLKYYKEENIIAGFINTIKEAEIYIYLIFSTMDNSEWRDQQTNKIEFIGKFNLVYNEHSKYFIKS